MKLLIQDIMNSSGVKFGTSGARGLAADMTDKVCYAYTKGFLQYLAGKGEISAGTEVAVAGDFRPSTPQIISAVLKAAADMGYTPVNCGLVPSPAVALYGITHSIPAIMVTGSHIPADRNGIKFNKCSGEILKEDEEAIRAQEVELDDALFNEDGSFVNAAPECAVKTAAGAEYVKRYTDFYESDCLQGMKVGVYQHSAVGRDMMVEILKGLGADVTALGFSETFIPVDTEAIRPEDVELAQKWAAENEFDAIVSTDGDSDRPLISNEKGEWLRGDIAGILCASYLGADSISTPVSCNSAVDKCGFFASVSRTRIGSPFVIASMNEATAAGAKCVVGYEANGGFLLNSDIEDNDKILAALPTRDALILHISILLLAAKEKKTISELVASLPDSYTASDRLQEFPQESSKAILARFSVADEDENKKVLEETFGELCGKVAAINRTDGVRVTFENSEVIHLRPSGNAPEFRCYNEAASQERVSFLNAECMKILRAMA